MAADPLTALRSQVEDAMSDPDLEPAERATKLRDLRDRITDIAGEADRYLSSRRKLDEAAASRQTRDLLWARDRADLREELARGGTDEHELDEMGLLSHAELTRLDEEGLLEAAVGTLRKAYDEAKHPRGNPRNAGQFAHTDFFKHDEGAIMAHRDRLRPTREDPPEHVEKAARYASEARQGLREKRKPLSVTENGDGTLSIIDGNSTYAALKDKLEQFPVKVQAGNADDAALDRAASEIHDAAVEAEPRVTPALKSVTAELGGELAGLEHKLKSVESIKSKIKRKQEKYPGLTADRAGLKVLDSVRYTAVFPPNGYVEGISKSMDALAKQGFEPYDLKNYWGREDDYDGFHAILSGPKGVKVEVQFHTPESLSTKEKLNHPLYEQFRDSSDPKVRYELWGQMLKNAASVQQPPGIESLGASRPSPSAEQRTRRHEASFEQPNAVR